MFENNLLDQDDYFKQLYWIKKLKIYNDTKESDSLVFVTSFEEETDEDKRCKFDAQGFSKLMSYLPNLQELDLKKCNSCDLYMIFLRSLDSTIYLKRIKRIYSVKIIMRIFQLATTFAQHSRMYI